MNFNSSRYLIMKTLKWEITISEKDKINCFNNIEWLLDFDFDKFRDIVKWYAQWLWKVFLNLWILKAKWDKKAIDLHKKMTETHRKDEKKLISKEMEIEKTKEMNINKNRFIKDWKEELNDQEKTLKKVRTIETKLWKSIVVWIVVTVDGYKLKFWWTTLISQKETPELYNEIDKNYHDYLSN